MSTQSGSDPGGLPPSCSCTSTLRSCIRHPWLPTHKDRRTSALAASINDLGWADLGSTRTGYPPILIYMGLRTSDPRIRKRPKLDQQGSNCHLRSAGRPFSEEAGPKPLHMAHATLSCWNPAGGRDIQEPGLLPVTRVRGRRLRAPRSSPSLARHLPAYNLGKVREGNEGECLPHLIQ